MTPNDDTFVDGRLMLGPKKQAREADSCWVGAPERYSSPFQDQ
jgi:hypothetical protein